MIASARRIIAAADGSKLGHTAHAYVAPVSTLSIVITTDEASADDTNSLTEAGTIVRTV